MKQTILCLSKHVTLYSRPNCGLCDNAKSTLSQAWDKSQPKFEYKEIDITKQENKTWFDLYVGTKLKQKNKRLAIKNYI